MEVNEDRKSEMNFDLEILGNKKEVVSTAKKEEAVKKILTLQINDKKGTGIAYQKEEESTQVRKCCDFLRKYQKGQHNLGNP